MSDLTITINDAEHTIPNTVQTEADILQAAGFDPDRCRLYRDVDTKTLTEEQRVGEPAVVDDGDAFVVVPKTVLDGG